MSVLAVVTVILVVLLLLVSVAFAWYRATHPHTRAQLEAARKQSIALSRATRDGRAYEQLVPYLPEFEERYARDDARLLGSPIDFIVFDGLYSGDGDVREIVFIEIKSGKPDLSKSERAVKRAVDEGRVRWDRIVLQRGRPTRA
jgi:predicted Holliday junction resolvase-like endonuclease